MTTTPSSPKTDAGASATAHLHFRANDFSEDPDWVAKNCKEFRKKTTIRAVQVECPFDVQTLEGLMIAKAGDWLAIGVNGEIYPIAADIFEKTYEPTAALDSSRSTDSAVMERLAKEMQEAAYDYFDTAPQLAAKVQGWVNEIRTTKSTADTSSKAGESE